MTLRAALLLALIALPALWLDAAPGGAESGSLIILDDHTPDMRKAIEKARDTLPKALEAASRGGTELSEGLSLKVTFAASNGNEHIWVNRIARDGDGFIGLLANEPRYMPGKRHGSAVEFKPDAIIDWALPTDQGKFFGHYTTRVLIQNIAPEERGRIRSILNLRPAPRGW